ncbi:conserved hypothetical protein [Vibrio phage 424E50-1]|nr:conserved hypothetical protein [Vibrio phage 424E50-1]CAH9012803.1 conserved hypothetical protein [Vibrio phage 501E54-1]
MSIVYFITEDGNSIVALDCEEAVSVSKQNSVSKYSVMSGKNVSDGYSEGNKVISLSGKVTYTKSASQQTQGTPTPIELQEQLDSFSENHYRFRVYTDNSSLPLLKGIDNCVLGGAVVTLGGWKDTIEVSMTIEEVFVSKSATTTFLPPIPSDPKANPDPIKGTGGKTEVSDKEKGTIFYNFKTYGNFSGNREEGS